jgi:hypothetical protein
VGNRYPQRRRLARSATAGPPAEPPRRRFTDREARGAGFTGALYQTRSRKFGNDAVPASERELWRCLRRSQSQISCGPRCSTHRFLDPALPVLALFLICRYSGSSMRSSLNECGSSLIRSRRGASLPVLRCARAIALLLELDLQGRSFSVNGGCCLALLVTDETRLVQIFCPPHR